MRRLRADLVLVVSGRLGLADTFGDDRRCCRCRSASSRAATSARAASVDVVGPQLAAQDGQVYPTGGNALVLGGTELRYNVTRALPARELPRRRQRLPRGTRHRPRSPAPQRRARRALSHADRPRPPGLGLRARSRAGRAALALPLHDRPCVLACASRSRSQRPRCRPPRPPPSRRPGRSRARLPRAAPSRRSSGWWPSSTSGRCCSPTCARSLPCVASTRPARSRR